MLDDRGHEHPMALASYLRVAAVASRLRRPPIERPPEWVAALVERLEATASAPGAWGLGFGWHEEDPDEPYAITTARCVTALVAAARTGDERALQLARRGAEWLTGELPWVETPAGRRAPAYSPSLLFALPNIAAQVAGALAEAAAVSDDRSLADEIEAAVAAVLDWQRPNGWWTYAPAEAPLVRGRRGDGRVDLVHSAYVLEGLLLAGGHPAVSAEFGPRLPAAVDAGLGVLSDLSRPDGTWTEKLSLRDRPPGKREASGDSVYEPPDSWWAPIDQESRPWGYGAALVALAMRGLAGRRLRIAARMLARVEAMSGGGAPLTWGESAGHVRHSSHLAEGLAFVAAAAQATTPSSR